MKEIVIEVKKTDILLVVSEFFVNSSEFSVKYEFRRPVLSYYHRPFKIADEPWKRYQNSYSTVELKTINYKVIGKLKDLQTKDKLPYVSNDAASNMRYGKIDQEFETFIVQTLIDNGLTCTEPIAPSLYLPSITGEKTKNPHYDAQWNSYFSQQKVFISELIFLNIVILKKHSWSKFDLFFK